ncbi:Ig-like domain-containing protein [Serratia rhizosphaerae]|uniref:Big-1 domain-containing protein n=1 Tax=Serratia rhizosphaerae TaxID=2597702 RepID=A0ABX6GHD1_9GAMM|nr:Ig-like domain-containing protein [Serratia rhizosphaerae]QHA85684.1 hypothetical protein FO014_01085 [Serratia rhizosphaerae]
MSNNPNAIIKSLEITNNYALADGIEKNTILALVCDDNDTPLPGQVVTFEVGPGANITSQVSTNVLGQALTSLTSTTAGGYTVTASVNPGYIWAVGPIIFVESRGK